MGDSRGRCQRTSKDGDLGVLSYCLGIEVQQSTAGITICQGAYAKKLLEIAGLADSNLTRTPTKAQLQLRKTGTTTAVDSTNYHSIVEILHYMVNTHPDLTYSVGYVSRFMEIPREERYYLGIEVQQSTAGITICQGAYAKKLLETVGLADSNPTRTPTKVQLQLRKIGTTTTVDSTNYRSIVESLRYLVNTCPDLSYSIRE